MTTFLIDKGQMSEEDVIRISSECLQQKVKSVVKLGGGANSKVYQVICPGGQYVAKFYFQHLSDSRDRLGTEFKSFSFLCQQGISQIPRPISISRDHQCAFYEYIQGKALGKDISQRDIDTAVSFLETLKDLSIQANSSGFAGASEAFFSVKDIVGSIQTRFERFDNKLQAGEYGQLQGYLNDEFAPLFKTVKTWSKDYLEENKASYDAILPQELRTLSPSDFGFHNALRMDKGRVVFLDFEYFGWDDPAKLVSDFLWHPAMFLSQEHKSYFVSRMSAIFGGDPQFKIRLRSVFPLFGLKWCLIFLNEFIPTDAKRRDFAHTSEGNKTVVRLQQLNKAKQMCKIIKTIYKDFPYGS